MKKENLALVIVSVIEYFASVGMEFLFNKRWWDYSYDKFNINGRISLRNSSLLAIGGWFLIYLVQPILDKVFGKISKKTIKISSIIIISIVSIDFILTIYGDGTHQKASANKNKYEDREIEIETKAYSEKLLKEINEEREKIGKKAFNNLEKVEII